MPAGLKPANASPDSTCASCSKVQKDLDAPLKACGGCRTALYCSKKCQDAARKAHGPECQAIRAGPKPKAETVRPTPTPAPAAAPSANKAPPRIVRATGPAHPSTPGIPQARSLIDMLDMMGVSDDHPDGTMATSHLNGLSAARVNPTRSGLNLLARSAKSNAYLSSFPESEAMQQLIFCFRLRCEDEYKFGAVTMGLYNEEDPIVEFRKFLNLAEEKNVVSTWWNRAKRFETERLAQDEEGKNHLSKVLDKADIIEANGGDQMMPMKLRGLAERIYGTPVIR